MLLLGGGFIEPDTVSHVAACVECCVRDRDFSEKKVYECELCGRWFCERHIKPRIFLIKGLDGLPDRKRPEKASGMGWIEKLTSRKREQLEWKSEDTHPDLQFTQKWLEELDIDEEKRSELVKRAVDRMNRYYSQEKLQAVNLRYKELKDKMKSRERLETERHFPTRDIAFLLVILALAILFWYAPTIISYLQRI